MRILFLLLLSTIYSASAIAQAPTPSPEVQITGEAGSKRTGAVTNGVFQSDAYGISVKIPSRFTVVSASDYVALNRGGLDLIEAESRGSKKIEEAENRAKSLLVIAAKPVGAPLNSALEISAAYQQRGVTANMVLAENIKIFKGSTHTLKQSYPNLKIGTRGYATADFQVSIGATKFYQRMYVVMHKGYSVVIVNTYHNDEQRDEMQGVLAEINFTK